VADLLERELKVSARLVEGDRGEFTVWVGDRVVSKKNWLGFPSDEKVLEAVREALAHEQPPGQNS
jgi:hypothetical protein